MIFQGRAAVVGLANDEEKSKNQKQKGDISNEV